MIGDPYVYYHFVIVGAKVCTSRFLIFGNASLFLLLLRVFCISVTVLALVFPFLAIFFKSISIRCSTICKDHLWDKTVFSFIRNNFLFY